MILKYRISVLVSALLSILFFAISVEAEPSDRQPLYFKVDEESLSPYINASVNSHIYVKNGDKYSSTKKSITAEEIENLRSIAIESDKKSEPNLEDFGITKESVAAHLDSMALEAIRSERNDRKATGNFSSLPHSVQKLLSYEAISKAALRNLKGAVSPASCLCITISGSPEIVLFSRAEHNNGLPFVVMMNGKTWTTYDRRLPAALAKIIQPEQGRILTWERQGMMLIEIYRKDQEHIGFWPEKFYGSYASELREPLREQRKLEEYRALPGWDKFTDDVTIENAELNWHDRDVEDMTFCKSHSVLDGLSVEFGKSQSARPLQKFEYADWYAVSEELKRAISLTAKARWLRSWKAEKPGRTITLILCDDEYFSVEKRNAIWNDMGFSGTPGCVLNLNENGDCIRQVYLSCTESNALVTDMGPRQERMMGSLRLRTAPSERICAVVDDKGATIRVSEVPVKYALESGHASLSAADYAPDESGITDYSSLEDMLYYHKKFGGLEEISRGILAPTEVRFGLIDRSGKCVLKPEWKSIGTFSDGLALVQDFTGKFGYADLSGKLVVPPRYTEAGNFYEGLAAVYDGDKGGYIDTVGNTVIPLRYDTVLRFSEGLAPARVGPYFGFLDKSGKWAVSPQYARARHFRDGLAHVQIDGEESFVNCDGKPIGGKYFDHVGNFVDNRAEFYDKKVERYGYIDKSGAEVIPAQFTRASIFHCGLAAVQDKDKRWTIDASGNRASMPEEKFWQDWDRNGKFSSLRRANRLGELKKGPTEFKSGNKSGFIDSKGNELVPAKYSRVFPFSNGLAVVQVGLKYGYVNDKGEEVIAPQFDAAHNFSPEGYAVVSMRVRPFKIELP